MALDIHDVGLFAGHGRGQTELGRLKRQAIGFEVPAQFPHHGPRLLQRWSKNIYIVRKMSVRQGRPRAAPSPHRRSFGAWCRTGLSRNEGIRTTGDALTRSRGCGSRDGGRHGLPTLQQNSAPSGRALAPILPSTRPSRHERPSEFRSGPRGAPATTIDHAGCRVCRVLGSSMAGPKPDPPKSVRNAARMDRTSITFRRSGSDFAHDAEVGDPISWIGSGPPTSVSRPDPERWERPLSATTFRRIRLRASHGRAPCSAFCRDPLELPPEIPLSYPPGTPNVFP